MKKLFSQINFNPNYLKYKLVIHDRDINLGYINKIFKTKPDIIIGGEYGLPVLLPYLIKKIFRKKYRVYTICDDSVQIAENCGKLRTVFRDFLAPRLDGIILVSKNIADWYNNYFKSKCKLIVFPILQDEKIFRQKLEDALPISKAYVEKWGLKDKKVWLFVGRLTEVKGLDRILNAFSAASVDKNARLIIVGEGDLLISLKQQAQELGISERVLFVGRYEDIELLAWYNIGSYFVFASHQEAFGAVVNEALIAGCKVLCSSRAGASCLIENSKNGYTFDTYNADEFSQQLSALTKEIVPIQKIQVRPSLMMENFNTNILNLIRHLNNE